ncbi:hypothetical protein QJS10_CPB04g01346 [Acorus calamus]|uniref:Ubiquitin-like protease family profile domain-containing protein n=1 Tax=Acorus calamus TaxID=4465 RepID=A0AAV9EY04_ACOCL|nr:hypothetical protein QJS10_CPB04g01346 [Acorus calamus]
MPMPINAVSPSTSSPNMKRKREQREQKLVSKKDMDKKIKPVPSKRTPDKVEKKKVGMAEAKYGSSSSKRMTSPSPGKRIGSIERMVKIRRSNIPKQCGKSKENQGDVAKKGPKVWGASKTKKGVTTMEVARGDAMRGAAKDNKPEDHAAMEACEVEALTKVTKEVDSILDDILNIPTHEGKAEEEESDKEKTVDEKKVEEQSIDAEVDMKEKTDDEVVLKEKTDDDDVLIEDKKCFSGPKRKRTVTLRKGPLTRSAAKEKHVQLSEDEQVALACHLSKMESEELQPVYREVTDVLGQVIDAFSRLMAMTTANRRVLYMSAAFNQYIDGGLERCERFFQAYKWKAEEDVLTQAKVVLVPMFTLHHWFLLVIDLMNSQFLLYDSLRKKEHTAWAGKAVKILQKTVLQETVEWPLISDVPAPQQSGGQDCGVYVCHWIACRMLDVRSYLNTKDDMAYMRAMITAAFMGDQFCKV